MLRAATAARQSVLVFDEFALSVLDAVLTQTEVLSLGYRGKERSRQASNDPLQASFCRRELVPTASCHGSIANNGTMQRPISMIDRDAIGN